MDKNVPYHLLAAFFEGSISPGQRSELDSWLNESAKNKEIFTESEKIWKQTGRLAHEFSPNPYDALAKVHQRIGVTKKNTRIITLMYSMPFKIAASLILIVGIVFLIQKNLKPEILTASTSPTTIQELILPDNSIVILNKNSKLIYPDKFSGNERRIQLTGEAIFKVSADKEKPFIIEAGHTQTKVLGTYFDLSAYEHTDSVIISLIEGSIEFSALLDTNKIILKPGEKAIYIKSTGTLYKNIEQSANITSWNSGIIEFKNIPLFEVCSDLNRIFGISIAAESTIQNLHFNGRFEKQKLPVIIQSIEEAMNVTAHNENGKIVFKSQN